MSIDTVIVKVTVIDHVMLMSCLVWSGLVLTCLPIGIVIATVVVLVFALVLGLSCIVSFCRALSGIALYRMVLFCIVMLLSCLG